MVTRFHGVDRVEATGATCYILDPMRVRIITDSWNRWRVNRSVLRKRRRNPYPLHLSERRSRALPGRRDHALDLRPRRVAYRARGVAPTRELSQGPRCGPESRTSDLGAHLPNGGPEAL
jgi:hypothetical protein